MATASERKGIITFSGDFDHVERLGPSDTNASSPGAVSIVTLAIGANTITPPGGGSSPKSVTIIPPSSNLATMTLKGVTGDTGVVLHITDYTQIALNSPTTTFVLTASAEIVGVRLVWA
jgi:hypothetical protein